MLSSLIVNIITSSAFISLMAISFGIASSHDKRLFHFAHGGIYVVGAYTAFALVNHAGISEYISIPLAIVSAGVLGSLIDGFIYRPLRRRGAATLVLLIASLGVSVILQNIVSLAFGSQHQTLRGFITHEGFAIAGARVTSAQVALIVSSAVLCCIVLAALRFTDTGKKIRAVASDPELANVVGIDRDKIITMSFFAGSALAAVAAILGAYDGYISPVMGFRVLLLGITALIIGGVGRIEGAVLGGVIVGGVQQLSVWRLPVQWQDATVFAILILFLLFRPQGLVGRTLKKSTV